jgi:adenylylsulfate kinase-like enzyme
VLCTFVSPIKKDRDRVRSLFPDGRFTEIHVKCDPKTAQERDPKGLYQKAKDGEIENLTGYNSDHEIFDHEDLITIDTDKIEVDEAVGKLLQLIKNG